MDLNESHELKELSEESMQKILCSTPKALESSLSISEEQPTKLNVIKPNIN